MVIGQRDNRVGAAGSEMPFVGREHEVDELRSVVADAGWKIVVGNPGSGKSRLVAEVTKQLEHEVLIARCAPETRFAPYGPIRQLAMRATRILDPLTIYPAGDPRVSDLGVIFPHLPIDPAVDGMATDSKRHALWLAWLTYVERLGSASGLTLIIEDLQWADDESLALVRWMSDQAQSVSLIATSRLPGPDEILGAPQLPLRPLEAEPVQVLLHHAGVRETADTAIRATGGVPLLLREWLHQHSSGAELLPAVGTLAIDALPQRCLAPLALASLIDQEVDLGLLAKLVDLATDELVGAIQPAIEQGLISIERGGVLVFSHDTYRETCGASLTQAERTTAHRAILAELRGQYPNAGRFLPRLAHHATEAARDGGRDEAIALNLAAGDRALNVVMASQIAATHYALALELAEMEGAKQTALDAELRLASALTRMSDVGVDEILLNVFRRADELGDGQTYARAALLKPESVGPVALPYRGDFAAARWLREAKNKLDAGDPLQARLSAELALQQHASLYESEYFALVASVEKFAIATSDPNLDAAAFIARHGVRRPVGSLQTRRDDALRRLNAEPITSPWHIQYFDIAVASMLRTGELGLVDEHVSRLEAELQPLPSVARWTVKRLRATIAHSVGDLATFEALSLEAMMAAQGTRYSQAAELYFAFQVAMLMRERRMTEEATHAVDEWVERDPTYMAFRAARAAQRADNGEHIAALNDLAIVFAQDLDELTSRVEGLVLLEMATSAAVVCEHAGYCKVAWQQLEPFRDEWIVIGAGTVVVGPVRRAMALASSVVGEHERAIAEITEAGKMSRRAGASLHEWHALRDRALILQRAGELTQANDAFSLAADRYQSAGLTEMALWCADRSAELSTMSTTDLRSNTVALQQTAEESVSALPESLGVLQRQSSVWYIKLGEEEGSLSHLKGLTMVAELLSNPGRPLTASQLSALAEGNIGSATGEVAAQDQLASGGSSQALVDEQAITAYRSRLQQLSLELDRADRREDQQASALLSQEFDALSSELASATGLGGRPRPMTNEDERARVRVTKAIRGAIRRIEKVAPIAGHHLNVTVSTGSSCVYQPDPRLPVIWKTGS